MYDLDQGLTPLAINGRASGARVHPSRPQYIRTIQAESFRHRGIDDAALADVHALGKGCIFRDGALESLGRELNDVGQRHIRQGVGAGPPHGAGMPSASMSPYWP